METLTSPFTFKDDDYHCHPFCLSTYEIHNAFIIHRCLHRVGSLSSIKSEVK